MSLNTHCGVIGFQGLNVLFASLVDDLRLLVFGQQGQSLGNHFIQHLGAETAADDQQAQRAGPFGKALGRRGDLGR